MASHAFYAYWTGSFNGQWVGVCPDHPTLYVFSDSPSAALSGIREFVEVETK